MKGDNLFTIEAGRWYAWQMMPGYGDDGVPYLSPIFVHEIKPLKTAKGFLRLNFFNAFYAEGVQNFSLKMKVLRRARRYLIADLLYGDRCAIVSELTGEWLRLFVAEWDLPDYVMSGEMSVDVFLNRKYQVWKPHAGQNPE
jgi:hypothetical protein